jgi:hypothetical protein
MATGYDQVRSVVAALAGDWDSARRVELVLLETGVCGVPAAAGELLTIGAASSGGCRGT